MSRRKKIPSAVEQEVLIKSRRRCCLCFCLNGDVQEKAGQIAHLDGKPDNNVAFNLVYLCFEHHDRYDSKTSQSKGLTYLEVNHYREYLYRTLSLICEEPLRTALENIDGMANKVRAIGWISEQSEHSNHTLLLSLLGSVQGWYDEIIEGLTDLKSQEKNLRLETDTEMRLGFAYVWRRRYMPNVEAIMNILVEREGMNNVVREVDSFIDTLTEHDRREPRKEYPRSPRERRRDAMAT